MFKITIDEKSSLPKYKQIVQVILSQISVGKLKTGNILPSINELSEDQYLARDTVEKAYKELRSKGIITSVRGKGFFIASTDVSDKLRIFLHFNKLSTYKKTVYNAFIDTIGKSAIVDIFIHHNNLQLFESQLITHLGNYTHYVVIPPDGGNKELIGKILRKIPSQHIYLLDKLTEGFESPAAVFQSFETDILEALYEAKQHLLKYQKLIMVFPRTRGYAQEVMIGFTKFCQQQGIKFEIVSDIEEESVQKKEAYIVIDDEDLVKLVKIVRNKKLQLGKELGILSYNEIPLKEVLAEGITVVSTDFEAMGISAAKMILNNEQKIIKNPFKLIIRSSL